MRILIPVDGSSFSDSAVNFVASRKMLVQNHPEVELVNVQHPVSARVGRAAGKEMVDRYQASEASKVIKPCVATLKRAGVIAQTNCLIGLPGPTVGKIAFEHDADLIVMGSHGHTGFKNVLFGSVTNAVLASCSTPLLVLRDVLIIKKDSLHIGIALDGGKYDVAAAKFVIKHRDLFGAEPSITLMHVVPDIQNLVIPGFLGKNLMPGLEPAQVEAMQRGAFEMALAAPQKLFKAAGLSVQEARLIGNNPGDAIANFAKQAKLDLVVLGSHGRGALLSVTLGSVSTRVAAKCRKPLLLIRKP